MDPTLSSTVDSSAAGTHPLDPGQFYEEALRENGIDVAFGVPDSSFGGLLSYIYATKQTPQQIVTANEGGAVALAVGYYLSTRKIALAYMQNSGYSNSLNPLQSVASKEAFGIPMLLLIGWRGKPGQKDEPQHALVGRLLIGNIKSNGIPYEEIPSTISAAKEAVSRLVATALKQNTPVALIIPNKTFSSYSAHSGVSVTPQLSAKRVKFEDWSSAKTGKELPLSRELTLRCLLPQLEKNDVVVCSLGGTSREMYMILKENGQDLGRYFFSVGAMGHAFSMAYGVATGFPSGRVICLDGDGSVLMHAGNNAVLAGISPSNLVHIIVNNGIHASTGGQPLMMSRDSFLAMVESFPYAQKFLVDDAEGFVRAWRSANKSTLIVVLANEDVAKVLPRPAETLVELKNIFMKSFD
jgi:phosphonopyruvate decarboxylase